MRLRNLYRREDLFSLDPQQRAVYVRCLTALFCLDQACKVPRAEEWVAASNRAVNTIFGFKNWVEYLKFLNMDITVSELMGNFMDTPLVVWVSECALSKCHGG